MKPINLKGIVGILVVVVLFGCAHKPIAPFTANDLNNDLKKGKYVSKVDNFIIVLDASGSMADKYKGQRKLDIARNAVNRINQTIPDIKLNGALRVIGQSYNPFARQSTLIYGVTEYDQAEFDNALKTVKTAAGGTPLANSIASQSGQNVIGDLQKTDGKIAAIVVSDAMVSDNSPLVAARNVKKQFGERICFYTILIGNDPKAKVLMEKIADIGECGFALTEEDIVSSEAVADYVKKVFLAGIDDQDQDGVLDNKDRCPDTPAGVRVDAAGCPFDTDRDGVYDYMDQCPGTPAGVNVTFSGCPLDTDGDGVYDYLDKCPGTRSWIQVNEAGCPPDSDGDGAYDYLDQCPDTPAGVSVDDLGCPPDSDKDGVYDYQDKCPGTPVGTPVDASGCPVDSDKDGVYDHLDQCPNTPRGATVNSLGCWVLTGLNFDTDKAVIKSKYASLLDNVIEIMQKNPVLTVEVEGHTDNQGRAGYNQKLSERRAKAVRQYLVDKGIDPGRVKAIGYGLEKPITTNNTVEGRQQNRRVEIRPIW